MKIGVDARILSGPVCGIRRYAECLLAEMVQQGHRWYLYLPAPAQGTGWSAENVVERYGRTRSAWMRVLWGHTALPAMAAQDQVDLLWSPAHRLPRRLPARCCSVVTIHDLVWRRHPESMSFYTRMLDRLEMPRSLAMADRVIAVSGATGAELVELFPAVREKLAVVHEARVPMNPVGGVGEDAFQHAGTDYLLCVGTREPRKNYARVLEAFARLVRDGAHPGLTLVIAGRNGWGVDLEGLARKLLIADRVHLPGEVDDDTLARFYRHARGFVMVSLYEGFGLPLLEAMHAGLPILTSDRSSMREIAADCALLVDPESVTQIAAGMARLLDEPALADRLRACGQARLADFSWKRAARETLAVFEQALDGRCHAPPG